MRKARTILFSFCLFCLTAKAQTLDNTFGNNDGLVINNFTQGKDGIHGMTLQNDGKILTIGRAGSRFVLVRYNTDGSFDSSFGNKGMLQTSFPFEDSWHKVLVQPDNKILVAATNNYKPYIARYNSDGTTDKTFGNNGVQYIVVQERDNPRVCGMTLLKDGKIVLTGLKNGNPSYLYVTRLNTDGSTDNSFGPDGTGLSLLSPAINYKNGTVRHSFPYGIDFNSRGDLFVQILFYIDAQASGYGLIKYSSSGIWDQEYGAEGIAPAYIIHTGQVIQSGFKILEDDKIISIGRKIQNNLKNKTIILTKYNTDGTHDTDFGTNGTVETIVTDFFNIDMEILSSGKILIAGDNLNTFTSILYHIDGQLDVNYGDNGIFTYKFEPNSNDFGRVVVQQTDGKVVIGGATSHKCTDTGFALMRLSVDKEIISGFKTATESDVHVYPNPTNGKVFIHLPQGLSDINIKIRNSAGQEISTHFFNNTNQIELDLDVENGIYFVQVIEKNNVKGTFKVIKK